MAFLIVHNRNTGFKMKYSIILYVNKIHGLFAYVFLSVSKLGTNDFTNFITTLIQKQVIYCILRHHGLNPHRLY